MPRREFESIDQAYLSFTKGVISYSSRFGKYSGLPHDYQDRLEEMNCITDDPTTAKLLMARIDLGISTMDDVSKIAIPLRYGLTDRNVYSYREIAQMTDIKLKPAGIRSRVESNIPGFQHRPSTGSLYQFLRLPEFGLPDNTRSFLLDLYNLALCDVF